jgi:chromosome segregation ATPase
MSRRPSIDYARISTMPRAQTEARGHLDRYQMAIEKARLEKELNLLEERRGQIHRRLQELSHSLEDLNYTPKPESALSTTERIHQDTPQPNTGSDSYQTFVLEF